MYRKPKPAFYLRWWFIILMLVLIFPLGLVLIICRVVWEVHQPKVEQIHPQRRNPGDYNFQPPQRSAPMSAPTPERATRFTLPQIPPRAADYQLPERELYTWRGLYDQLSPGTRLYFADEGDAVRAYNSNGVRGGEVPHGTLERLLSLCLSRGDVVVGEVTHYDGYGDLRAIIDIYKAYPYTYTDLRELSWYGGKYVIVIAKRGKDRTMVAIPSDVEEAIFGEERREMDARLARSAEVEKEYTAHVAAVEKAMNP